MKIRFQIISAIILLFLQLTGCAMWKYHSWSEFQVAESGFSIQVPGKPRHFTMATSSSINKEEYDQWTVIDSRRNQQFFIILAKYDKSQSANMGDNELLDNINRPTVGFLSEATQIKAQRQVDNGYLMEEQEWQLSKRTNHARSRIYIFDGKIIELIHVYSVSDKEMEAGDHFFASLVIE
ncbi:MAG: hypothetical protein P9X26_00270 [Candidatus Stygibacter frigidus]|nr:hypothetical protein [Candidatus Stygibacter frigidus]